MTSFEVTTVRTSRQVWTVDDPDMVESILGETSVDTRMMLLRRHGVPTKRGLGYEVVSGVEQAVR